jgi:hypothetical protein
MSVERIAVVGAGAMGRGIAHVGDLADAVADPGSTGTTRTGTYCAEGGFGWPSTRRS